MQTNRRRFLKNSIGPATGLAALSMFPQGIIGQGINHASSPAEIKVKPVKRTVPSGTIRFSVIGLNHGHIYEMTDAVIGGGGKLVSVYALEPELLSGFKKRYPGVRIARSEEEILGDKTIQMVVSASIPVERAPLGIRVMKAGKDFMVDKPGIITMSQYDEVRKVQKAENRIYSIMYGERLGSPAAVKAGELVMAGAIGKVVQTIGLGPHRMNPASRPAWFFDPSRAGGILCDIGSHQCDQFLFYTGSPEAEVVVSQVGNFNTAGYPAYRDFGDMIVRSPHATGYIRIDWFTPDGLATWGDGRTFILGTEGYIELRKYIDIAGRKGGNHLFLVNRKETVYYDCSEVRTPYGEQLVNDVINRTETSMSQEHCFLAAWLALSAQEKAREIGG